jgi:hypothetical protein
MHRVVAVVVTGTIAITIMMDQLHLAGWVMQWQQSLLPL